MSRSSGPAGPRDWARRTADFEQHLADLESDSYESAHDRAAGEAIFRRAVDLVSPVVTDVLEEVGRTYAEDADPITFDMASDELGLTATWSLGWPAQRAARRRSALEGPPEVPPIRISAIFPPGWTHGHLRGEHVGHWPLQITTAGDAARQRDVVWAIAEAELHEWIYTAAQPWDQLARVDRVAAFARRTPAGWLVGQLRAGRAVSGIFIRGTHAEATMEAAAAAGLDFVVVDREHGVPTPESELVSTCEIAYLRGVAALLRIAAPLPYLATQALDQGAAGVVIPQCRSVDEVLAVLDRCYLPPRGSRGYSPRTRAASRARSALGSATHSDVVRAINESTSVVVQVETPELLEQLDALAADDRVTALLLGAHDLAVAMGDPDADMIESASARLEAATASGPVAWGLVVGPSNTQRHVNAGARFLIRGSEAALSTAAIEALLDEEITDGP